MDADGSIGVQGRGADEGGEFACGLSTLQVHLEEPFLRVHEPDRASEIDA